MATKEYKDLTPKEKYDSAIKADKAPWDPIQTAKDLIKEKLGNKKSAPASTKPAENKKSAVQEPDYEGEMGYSPEEMAEVEQARKRLAKQGIYKNGGKTKCMAKGGSASARADGCAIRGKTRA